MIWVAVIAFIASFVLGALALTRRKARKPRPKRRDAVVEPIPPSASAHPAEEQEASWRAGVVILNEFERDDPTATFDRFQVRYAARSDLGKKRRSNEDSLLCLGEAPLLVVADGMGGAAGGEIASRTAVREVAAAFSDVASPSGNWPIAVEDGSPDDGERLLLEAICRANDAIRKQVRRQPELRGMGTTIVAAFFAARKNRVYVAHVGDSRAYRVRDGAIVRLTNDHTLAEVAGARGELGDRLAWALGAADEMTIDVRAFTPELGDRFVLCSDGLTKPLSDDEIAGIVGGHDDLEQCAARLIDLANERGGPDNVTAIVAEVVAAVVNERTSAHIGSS